jgi:hypothetical protein
MGTGPKGSFHVAQTTPERILFEDVSIILKSKSKDKVHHRTSHKGPDGE